MEIVDTTSVAFVQLKTRTVKSRNKLFGNNDTLAILTAAAGVGHALK